MKKRILAILCLLSLLIGITLSTSSLAFSFSDPADDPAAPTERVTVTIAPTSTPAPEEPTDRYCKTNTKGVNVREKASAKSDIIEKVPNSGTVLAILDVETDADGIAWYAVEVKGKTGFIRSDLVDEISESEYAAAASTVKPSGGSTSSSTGGSGSGSGGSKSSSGSSSKSSDTSPSSGQSVWIVTNGKCYHRTSTCSNMKAPWQVSAQEAKNSGRTACSKCW